ncbi:Aminopeptidase YwaD precursor [Planctomycetes bacterium CA13]|uniref:Aminopeptidase YwaD n=1 Tax=Novipirellula herctigrandis TaxID=2527986 RepID=A0A5C5Z0U6_9BACT|nr:Aminopeptidase YwaD precursor [Planctomycetes bacterium CA13]
MRIGMTLLIVLIGGIGCFSVIQAERPLTIPPRIQWQIQQRADLEYLACEELRGRGVEDDTIHMAADYIAERFRDAGLRTELFAGKPFQELEIPVGARAGKQVNNYVRLRLASFSAPSKNTPTFDVTENLSAGMNPLAIGSLTGKVDGEIVFAGYGITAPKFGYDDYAHIDAAGKAVIVLRKEPGINDPDSPFDGRDTTQHAFFQSKVENAIRHGAAAVLMVNDPTSIAASLTMAEDQLQRERVRREAMLKQLASLPAEAINIRAQLRKRIEETASIREGLQKEWEQSKRGVLAVTEAGGSRFTVKTGMEAQETSIPVVSIARDTIDLLLTRSIRRSLVEIENSIDETHRPQSVALENVSLDLSVAIEPANAKTANVIGELPGRGPLAEQTVVIGAHYDHVGMGGYGSLAPGTVAIHNGADDNASGTVTMMAMAELLSRRMEKMASHRRVVLIAFTGEERGLFGSKYYVRHPRFPLASTVTMINLDMVGRLRDNELTIYGTGSGKGLSDIVDTLNTRYRFDLNKVDTGYGPSDHQSFYEAGIPVLFFFTGLHNDYHRPSDDFNKIDYGGLTRITDMVCDVAFQVATNPQRPIYTETENNVPIRRQLTAFLGVKLNDLSDQMVLSGVTAGGPAEKAGLKAGDRLEQFGEQPVRTKTEVIDFLRRQSPGDSLTIQITRENQSLHITVRLEARPDG